MLIIKRFFYFLAAVLLLEMPCAFADFDIEVSAQCCVLMHQGRCLYEKNADKRVPIASTTKLMTAVIVLENCDTDETITADTQCCGVEGSTMYLKEGDTLSVEELLKGLLLVSGNDAAIALAKHTAGDIDGFVNLMNEKAALLGMKNTHFANPHGLSDTGHYSTARDMALLMEYCMQNDTFMRLSAMKSCTVKGLTLINHNKLLYMCPGCTGGKTGFTEAAGRCLVSCCLRENIPLVCVTLNAQDDWNDHMELYNTAYSKYELRNVTEGMRFSAPLISGESKWAYLVPERELSVLVEKGKDAVLTVRLPWFVFAPINAGERGGKAEISVDGETIGEYYLIYCDNISSEKGNT